MDPGLEVAIDTMSLARLPTCDRPASLANAGVPEREDRGHLVKAAVNPQRPSD